MQLFSARHDSISPIVHVLNEFLTSFVRDWGWGTIDPRPGRCFWNLTKTVVTLGDSLRRPCVTIVLQHGNTRHENLYPLFSAHWCLVTQCNRPFFHLQKVFNVNSHHKKHITGILIAVYEKGTVSAKRWWDDRRLRDTTQRLAFIGVNTETGSTGRSAVTYEGHAIAGALSLCLLFLNQLLTCVSVSPVFLARLRFSSGVGYLHFNNE